MPYQESDLLKLIEDRRVTSFGDASCPPSFKFDDVEVLAAIPDHVSDRGLSLPGKEYKYKDYSRLCKQRLHATVSKWDDVICHASIYIYDPKGVIGLIASQPQFDYRRCKFGTEAAQQWLENYLAWQTVLLMPDVWLDALAFRDEYVIWSDPSHTDIPSSAERILRSGDWKVVNVRRQALMSHHMYQDLLWRRPITTLFDATNKVASLVMPIRDVILAVVPNVSYDAGHSKDIPLLEQGRRRIRGRLDHYGMAVPLPLYVPGSVAEIESHLDFRIQAADIAAGKARSLYNKTGLIEVRKFYREVYLNGEKVT